MTNQWTERRLARLFERYNRVYWRGQVPQYRIIIASLGKENRVGRCDWKRRLIEIDVAELGNDRRIRNTLLHEMVHAATRTGHGIKFFAQMERLLRRGALVGIETGDAGRTRFYGEVVPRRFPLLRKKMQRLEARRASAINRLSAEKKLNTHIITDEYIIGCFGDVEVKAMTWKMALLVIGHEYGLTDDTGRPVNAWATRIIAKGKRIHRSARREYLQVQKLWAGRSA